jgi:ribosomal protein L11 methyltransferase
MAWVQFSIEVSREQSGLVTDVLESAGAVSTTLLDAADEPLLEPVPGEQPLWRMIRVVALFPADFNHTPVVHALKSELNKSDLGYALEPLEDRDWSNTWRDSFQSMCFGDRLWVCPVGEFPPDPEAVVISMDPGMAFGTGTHTTTALCLEWLDANPPIGKQVIDYGCGSGILAIAAHKLGAASVQAVDIDLHALTVARDNASRNNITRDFDVMHPQALPAAQADLVLANILANPLIELVDELSRRVCSGGLIVLTGILEEQAGEVMTAYQPRFVFTEPVRRDGWVRLDGTRR